MMKLAVGVGGTRVEVVCNDNIQGLNLGNQKFEQPSGFSFEPFLNVRDCLTSARAVSFQAA